ncbi:hypothetical protein V0288_10675 [Pannus brasiliensis CCIBt3594]|uniref:Uncharacterized protein n=1 Tax=Pannus brasiliensis CCIBt3594 TaxID=1427578 RepID=A0AAW9QIE6_9CHRO
MSPACIRDLDRDLHYLARSIRMIYDFLLQDSIKLIYRLLIIGYNGSGDCSENRYKKSVSVRLDEQLNRTDASQKLFF